MSRGRLLSRVLLYSHDSYGLGHLRRNLVIARELLAGRDRPQVVLASGSPVLSRIQLPEGLCCAALPPVTKTGPDEYRPLQPEVSMSLVSRARSAVLCDIVERWRPDVLLVDHAPQGVKGELLAVFDAIRRRSPGTAVVLGLRDILDEPALVRSTWSRQGVYDTLASVYDEIIVYGEREVFDLVRGYELPEPLASSVEYCGYVTGERSGALPLQRGRAMAGETGGTPAPDGRPYLFGTIGGGGDGAEVLAATAHAAGAIGVDAVLCTGPLMSPEDRRWLGEAIGSRPGVTVLEHVDDIGSMAAGAACVVSRGGYNTLCELLSIEVPVVVVPRVWPRREQLLRAGAFAARGLVTVVDPTGPDLADRVERGVEAAVGGLRDRRPLDMGGAPRVVEALRRAVAREHARAARVPA